MNGFPTMTPQNTAALQQALTALGMFATAFGWTTKEDASNFVTWAMALVGPLMLVAGPAWALLTTRRNSVITSVSQMTDNETGVPLVRKIELNPKAPDAAVVNAATPANVVVGQAPVQGSMSGIPPDVFMGDHHE
jgi:hypothetical protein